MVPYFLFLAGTTVYAANHETNTNTTNSGLLVDGAVCLVPENQKIECGSIDLPKAYENIDITIYIDNCKPANDSGISNCQVKDAESRTLAINTATGSLTFIGTQTLQNQSNFSPARFGINLVGYQLIHALAEQDSFLECRGEKALTVQKDKCKECPQGKFSMFLRKFSFRKKKSRSHTTAHKGGKAKGYTTLDEEDESYKSFSENIETKLVSTSKSTISAVESAPQTLVKSATQTLVESTPQTLDASTTVNSSDQVETPISKDTVEYITFSGKEKAVDVGDLEGKSCNCSANNQGIDEFGFIDLLILENGYLVPSAVGKTLKNVRKPLVNFVNGSLYEYLAGPCFVERDSGIFRCSETEAKQSHAISDYDFQFCLCNNELLPNYRSFWSCIVQESSVVPFKSSKPRNSIRNRDMGHLRNTECQKISIQIESIEKFWREKYRESRSL